MMRRLENKFYALRVRRGDGNRFTSANAVLSARDTWVLQTDESDGELIREVGNMFRCFATRVYECTPLTLRPLLAFSTLRHARMCTGNNRDGQGELTE